MSQSTVSGLLSAQQVNTASAANAHGNKTWCAGLGVLTGTLLDCENGSWVPQSMCGRCCLSWCS